MEHIFANPYSVNAQSITTLVARDETRSRKVHVDRRDYCGSGDSRRNGAGDALDRGPRTTGQEFCCLVNGSLRATDGWRCGRLTSLVLRGAQKPVSSAPNGPDDADSARARTPGGGGHRCTHRTHVGNSRPAACHRPVASLEYGIGTVAPPGVDEVRPTAVTCDNAQLNRALQRSYYSPPEPTEIVKNLPAKAPVSSLIYGSPSPA